MSRRRLVATAAVLAALVGAGLLRVASSDEPSPDVASGVPAGAERARVVSHVDGDTVRLVGTPGSSLLRPDADTRVRLLEIDTPEVGTFGGEAECFAEEASEALADLLPVGADVWVTRDRELLDPYDRTLLYLWTSEGDLVNLEMVRLGYARAVLFEPNDAYLAPMRRAESEARAARRGLWAACD